ncbi:hypothetical protein J007_01978 [Cryptococcus neoformans]|nr:hypothetical protein J007_01978 [Cryptococcus neoformans var. grubii]OXC62593.1 hypothetical protein C358_02022 [Cryptococcus neoformans var. grubii MW-RSA852]
MSQPEWQSVIRERLIANQQQQEPYTDIVDQYRKLAKTTRELKVRNKALLKSGGGGSGGGGGPDGNAPLLTHLDAQLTSLRNELSTLYRSQAVSQNKQLQLTDAIRERDATAANLRDELNILRADRAALEKRVIEWDLRWKSREKDMETLSDEIMSLNLEISALTERNEGLLKDNANLLQRWLDKMNERAEEMNQAFEKEAGVAKGFKEEEEKIFEEAFEEVEPPEESEDDEGKKHKGKAKATAATITTTASQGTISKPSTTKSTITYTKPPTPTADPAKPRTSRTPLPSSTSSRLVTKPRTSSNTKPFSTSEKAEKEKDEKKTVPIRSATPRSSRPSSSPSPSPVPTPPAGTDNSTSASAGTSISNTGRKSSTPNPAAQPRTQTGSRPGSSTPSNPSAPTARRSPSASSLRGGSITGTSGVRSTSSSVRDKIRAMEGNGMLPRAGSTTAGAKAVNKATGTRTHKISSPAPTATSKESDTPVGQGSEGSKSMDESQNSGRAEEGKELGDIR